MPSATGQNWEKFQKEFRDDEEPEKKIIPLTAEDIAVLSSYGAAPYAAATKAIEKQIKQQLAGKSAPPSKEVETGPPSLVPAGNFTRHEAPAIIGEPDLSRNTQATPDKQKKEVCLDPGPTPSRGLAH